MLQQPLRSLFAFVVLSFLPICTIASLSEAELSESIVSVRIHDNRNVIRTGTGLVVQADRFNGYVLTNAELISGADSLTVRAPGTGAQLVAQVIRSELSSDYALLKVNGLDLQAITFALNEPVSGEVVWSVARLNDVGKLTMIKGLLRTGYKLSDQDTGWYQHTATIGDSNGAALLNECGEVVGLNFTRAASDGSVRAVDLSTLLKMLREQNIKLSTAESECLSEIVQAREAAEFASAEAKRAQDDAARAQAVASDLERQLQASKRSSDDLVKQTRLARESAESAIRTADLAEAKAEETRRELEEKTSMLREETQQLLKAFEEDRVLAEERFQELMTSQQEAADSREKILIGFSGALIIIIAIVLFLARYRAVNGGTSPRIVIGRKGDDSGHTQIHREELAEYVLDGRDDDGIRYLLRISGDQLVDRDGVIIGRNPKDSPYIINHADVSRKHARIKVMKNRVFIEDLGSTNGTSVNGQSIDDKGLVSVSNGDQIIIGSVVMKLRVMEG